jgi:nitroreductase/NAD-dependent dihydropyrimidine dehydrogenase PreA subunit
MNLIEIDSSLCIGCGQCVMSCINGAMQQKEKGKPPFHNTWFGCIRCGHCVSVCPKGAISHTELDSQGFVEFKPAWNADDVEMLLRSKRSMRRFLDKPVPRDVLERLLSVAVTAPTDANTQDRGFLVLSTRESIDAFETFLVDGFRAWLPEALKQGIKEGSIEVLRTKSIIKMHEAGFHPAFREAPVVICAFARTDNVFGWYNCAGAMDYLMIQAHAMGLGSCVIGEALYAPVPAARYLKLPDGMRLHSTITLGYPAIKYKRTVSRVAAKVIWK